MYSEEVLKEFWEYWVEVYNSEWFIGGGRKGYVGIVVCIVEYFSFVIWSLGKK